MEFVTGRLSMWNLRVLGLVGEPFDGDEAGCPPARRARPTALDRRDAQMSTHLRLGWLTVKSPRTELPGTQSLASSSSRHPSLIASPSVTSLATLNASLS